MGYIYHVTLYNRLSDIADEGLQPGRGRGIGSNLYDTHRKGAIFLTEGRGVVFWASRAEEWIQHDSDNPHDDELAPVILRIDDEIVDACMEDELGTQDARADAFRCEFGIDPDDIEVWVGDESSGEWVDIEDWVQIDFDSAFEFEDDEETGERIGWLRYASPSPLIKAVPNPRKRKVARRRKTTRASGSSRVSTPQQARKHRKNPLLAIPPKGVHGLEVAGVRFFESVVGRPVRPEDYHGVHTSDDKNIAAVYATGATYRGFRDGYQQDDLGAYPVIISIDTAGLEPLPDVDALARAADFLEDQSIRLEFDGMSLDEARDMWEYEGEVRVGMDVGAAIMEGVVENSIVSAFEREEDWERWQGGGEYTPLVAIALVRQKRFLADIGYDRLVAVEAMKPWWPYVLEDPYDEPTEEQIERITAAGYAPVTVDDLFRDQVLHTTVVARGPAAGGSVEYHGTSSTSAAAAFPEVQLPPNPYPVVALEENPSRRARRLANRICR